MIDVGLWIGYLLTIGGAMGMLGFSILNIVKNPKNAKLTVFGVGATVVLFLLSWLISSGNLSPKMMSLQTTEASSKLIGAGFILLYLMGIISLIAIFYTETKNLFSKK
jgi:hypothetical protein